MDVPRLINISSLSLFLHFSFLVVVVNITMKIVALFLLCNFFNSSTTLASHILSVHNVKTTTSKHNHLIREQRKRAKRLLLQNLPPSTLKRPGKKRVKLSVVDDVGLKRLKDLPVPSLSRSAYGGHEARHSQAYPNDKKLNQLLRDK